MDWSRMYIRVEGKETCLGTSTAELPVGLCFQLRLSGTSKD